jgi:multicomponent Na+:H+ antiporter subunit F
MMDVVYSAVAIFLLFNILVGVARTLRGPSASDRMITAQLFGTLGVAILLVLAERLDRPALRDVALVYVILGVVAVVAFASRAWPRMDREEKL